jgi:hypothetical protein
MWPVNRAPHDPGLIIRPHQARPCPFYSQGRCLFSDSCAFLHEVKIKVPKSSIYVPSSAPAENADKSSEPIDPMSRSGSPTSPNRSPRMTSLLQALKGVISDEDLEAEMTDEETLQAIENPPRFVSYGGPENADLEGATLQIPHAQLSPEVTYGLHMPAEASEDPPIPPPDHPPEAATTVVDVGLNSIHPPSSTSTARESRPFSPQASDKPSRDDSIDSGYAELRASTPQTLSTPLAQWKRSTLNLLSSPFGSPTTRAFPPARSHLSAIVSPRFGSFPSFMSERAPSPTECVAATVDATRRHSDDAKPRRSTSLNSLSDLEKDPTPDQDDPFVSPSPSSLDSPEAYPALPPNSPPPHEDDEEVESLVMKEPNRKRASSILTVMPRSEATESPPPLPESLPWVPDPEDDTVTSMYGLYHSSSSDHVWSPPSPTQNYSRPSSSASFYPPRPSSVASELLSPKSSFDGTGSPLVPSRSSSALSIRTDLGPQSSTVPIGFRDQKRHGSRRASTVFRRPQPLILSPPHSAIELQNPLSSGSRSLKPLRLSTILNSGQSLTFPMNETPSTTPPPAPSPSPSTQSDFSISNSRLLSSARSSIIPGHMRNTSSTNDLSPLLLGTPSGSHQHYLPNFGSLSNIVAPSPTPSQVSASSSVIRRRYNPLIPNREFRDSVHSRASSSLSEPFYAVREEEEDVWNDKDESTLNIDPEDPTLRHPFSISPFPHLGNSEEESAQLRSAFTDSPVSTAAPILDEMIDAHAANPSRSSSMLSGSSSDRLPPRRLQTATFPPHAQSVHSTPHPRSAPVFTKDPTSSTIINSRHPTHTHTRRQPSHAIATPRPTLMFAIASDDVSQVQRVLDTGEANPNDQVGPQSALKFALTNNQLTNRLEIVKTLLAYGADPAGLRDSPGGGKEQSRRSSVVISGSSPAHFGYSLNGSEIDGRKEVDPAFEAMKSQMDPATRYFINRADAPKTRRTSALIHRSFFRPLARMRYDVVGQDCAFEQLFKCLSIQSQNLSVSPLVVMLCGPSGHGKSLFARKFGSLLGVPTHTVNMTTLRSTHDLWQSYSMSPYEEPSTLTLAEFLTGNEGNRCVVVLDVRDFLDIPPRRIRS